MKFGLGKKRALHSNLTKVQWRSMLLLSSAEEVRVISRTTGASPSSHFDKTLYHLQESVALIATGPSVASHLPLIAVLGWFFTASRNKS